MADRGMNDDLLVVGDRVYLNGVPAHWLEGELRAFPNGFAYTQGQRGTVVRTGHDARNACITWDATVDEDGDDELITEWVAACCLKTVTYSSGLRDGIPEPYSATSLRMLPGSQLVVDVALLVNGGARADVGEARERLRAALTQRRFFTITLPRVDPPPLPEEDA